jgi:hypothetical protein
VHHRFLGDARIIMGASSSNFASPKPLVASYKSFSQHGVLIDSEVPPLSRSKTKLYLLPVLRQTVPGDILFDIEIDLEVKIAGVSVGKMPLPYGTLKRAISDREQRVLSDQLEDQGTDRLELEQVTLNIAKTLEYVDRNLMTRFVEYINGLNSRRALCSLWISRLVFTSTHAGVSHSDVVIVQVPWQSLTVKENSANFVVEIQDAKNQWRNSVDFVTLRNSFGKVIDVGRITVDAKNLFQDVQDIIQGSKGLLNLGFGNDQKPTSSLKSSNSNIIMDQDDSSSVSDDPIDYRRGEK